MGRRSVVPAGLLGVLPLVVAVAAGGCSGGTPGGSDTSFAERLRFIPASVTEVDGDGGEDGAVEVTMADLSEAAEVGGVERPPDASDPERAGEFIRQLTGTVRGETPAPVAIPLPTIANPGMAGSRQDRYAEELGWSLVDVEWFAEHRVPPGLFAAMGGDFEEARLEEAMGAPEDGVWRLGGEDLSVDVEDTSVARRMGESLRLALDHDRLLMSRATPPVEDALHGGADTLADDPSLRAMAEALDEHDAYSAVLRSGGSHEWAEVVDRAPGGERAAEEPSVLPEPFVGVGLGLAYEDGRATAVLVYTHDEEAAAEANAEALPDLVDEGRELGTARSWSETFTVEGVEVERTTVVARLRIDEGVPAARAYDVVDAPDGLALHD